MAWTLTAVRQAITTRLATISGLNTFAEAPAAIMPPAAAVAPPAGGVFVAYDDTFEGAATLSLVITLWVAKVDEPSAQQALDAYIASTGASSIKAAVDSGATADWEWAVVGDPRDYGAYVFGTGASALTYLGCTFPVTVSVL